MKYFAIVVAGKIVETFFSCLYVCLPSKIAILYSHSRKPPFLARPIHICQLFQPFNENLFMENVDKHKKCASWWMFNLHNVVIGC